MSLMHRKRNHVAMDRISNLPCNVIDDILKYLPMCDAVRTSILSRGWRYKWLTIPYLVFENFEGSGISRRGYNVDSVIYQVLVQHKGPIVKFIWGVFNGYIGRPALDHCLNFLSNHRIEELTLCFFWEPTPQTMPHHLFTFDHLTHLHLINCELKPPLSFKGFDRLVKLDLDGVLIEPEMFIRFMSRFPMLEHLTLNSVHLNVPDLEIDAPNLKSFCFIFVRTFPSICFKSTSLLEVVSITSYKLEISEGCRYNLIEFCGQLSSIKKLKLEGGSLLQLLARGGVPQKLLNNLGNLTNLQCQINFASRADVSGVLCLIRNSPNLQSLEIIESTFINIIIDGVMKPASQFLKEQQNCKLIASHLKNVKIGCFSGSESGMEFVKLILSGASSLLKLELKLNCYSKDAGKKEFHMLRELARFRRASPEAEIIIQDH